MTDWRKSTYSGDQGECVEVAYATEGAQVRDTKNRDAGQLAFNADAWSALVQLVK